MLISPISRSDVPLTMRVVGCCAHLKPTSAASPTSAPTVNPYMAASSGSMVSKTPSEVTSVESAATPSVMDQPTNPLTSTRCANAGTTPVMRNNPAVTMPLLNIATSTNVPLGSTDCPESLL